MTESTFLGGKVRRWSLPQFQGAPPPGAPILKRLLLNQGELAQFYDGADGVRYLAFVELRADSVRGNHYHHKKEEYIYVIAGQLRIAVEDATTRARESFHVETGDLVFIQTGVAHLLQTLKPGQAVEFSTARFDPEDIVRYPMQ